MKHFRFLKMNSAAITLAAAILLLSRPALSADLPQNLTTEEAGSKVRSMTGDMIGDLISSTPGDQLKELVQTLIGIKSGGEISLENASMTLDRAVITAAEHSRMIKSAELDFEMAQEKISETRAQFGFNLNIQANYQRVQDPTAFGFPLNPMAGLATVMNPITFATSTQLLAGYPPEVVATTLNQKWQHGADLNLIKPLFTFGKKTAAITATRRDRDMKQIDVELSRLDLVLKVKESFHQLLLAYKVLETYLETAGQTDSHLKAAETRLAAGSSPKLDVIRAKGEVEKSREDVINAVKQFELIRMSFNNTLGFSLDKMVPVSDLNAYRKIKIQSLNHYTDLALKSRSEIKKVQLAQELARLSAQLAKNKPGIALTGTYNIVNKGSGFASENSWRAILGAEIPVFDNGIASAKVSQAHRLEEKIKLAEVDLHEGILLQTEQAFFSLLEAEQRLKTSRAILDTAQEGYRMADIGFKEGVIAQIDLLDAEHSLTGAKLNLAVANYDYEVAKAQLARACGVESIEE